MEEENDLAKGCLRLKERIAQWWGPKGMKTNVLEHDFKVGGKWKYTMKMSDGSDFIGDGAYLAIVTLEKIFTSANFKPTTEGVEIRALFKKNGAKTDFTFRVVHPTEEYRNQQEKMSFYNGWASTLDRFENFVSSLNKK